MGLTGRLQRIVYGDPTPESTSGELRLMTQVDLAHVVMLTECGLLSPCHAAMLLREIRGLREQDFEALHQVAMPRGLYMAYEQHLIAVLGPEVGGRLHTGRSRNDLKATTTALRLRSVLLDLLTELTRLQAVLLSRARHHRETAMPIYTHYHLDTRLYRTGDFGRWLPEGTIEFLRQRHGEWRRLAATVTPAELPEGGPYFVRTRPGDVAALVSARLSPVS